MNCLYCRKQMSPDEPCYDYFPVVGGETMGQCDDCLRSDRDAEAVDECRVEPKPAHDEPAAAEWTAEQMRRLDEVFRG